MYSRLARSSSSFAFREIYRGYATRRILKEASSTPLTTVTRSYQSTGQLQGHSAQAEARVYEGSLDPGTINGKHLPSSMSFPPSRLSQIPSEDLPVTQIQSNQDVTGSIVASEVVGSPPAIPLYHRGTKYNREPYWKGIGRWENVTEKKFLSHSWNVSERDYPYDERTVF